MNENRNALVAYHADCLDGFTAAWVTHNTLISQGIDCGLLAMKYGSESIAELFKVVKEEEWQALFVVDFSLPTLTLKELKETYPDLITTILDHHKTAFEEYMPEMKITPTSHINHHVEGAHVILDNSMSGASLCESYFRPQLLAKKSRLVAFVEDYDLWRFNLGEETKWINKYLMLRPKTLKQWDSLAAQFEDESEFKDILYIGKQLQHKHDIKVEEVAKKATIIKLGEEKGLAVDCPRDLISDVGHSLATTCGTFGAMYQSDTEKQEVTWSLRSNGDYDVSAIAKTFGGGGHKNAAGFTIPMFKEIPEDE